MALKLYNSLGREVQPFRPIKEGEVKMYTCGPTVWNYAHIGNFRTFVFEDLLRRHLEFKGYKVRQVMNITDVEDRIIRGIEQFKKTRLELTSFYERAFMEDLATLGVEPAEVYPRASENIGDMVNLVKVLLSKGYAYKAQDGSVYFDVSKFKTYGALSGVKLGAGKKAGRVSADHYEEKKEAADFALWKAWDENDGDVFWETELGKGRPGWSIECSAMGLKYLGDSFDIHAGGMDLKFPHHENEIAQSEAATGKKFVNYWLHSEFLHVKGEEMHKSVGNVVYLRDLVKSGWELLTIRLFLISSRYRDPIDLTDAALEQARAQRARLVDFVARLKAPGPPLGTKGSTLAKGFLSDFEEAMDDDLNTPRALAVLFTFVKKVNSMIDANKLDEAAASEALAALERVNGVLGVLEFGEESLPPNLSELIVRRDEARKRKDFAESDRLRKELLASGVVVEDTPGGTRWKRVSKG
ncbi:MAG TPA: cysteine--tRNA ligase [Nitrososphaerales archaeon]|nr:cysteine--tRNA ligase [Nitrososphaerales archaeon]